MIFLLRSGKNKDNVDLRLGKASLEVDAPAKVILDVVWNLDNHRVCNIEKDLLDY